METIVNQFQIFLGLKKATKAKVADDEEPEEESKETEKIGFLNDIVFENKLLNQCGLGVSEEESYLIFTSLKNFNRKMNAVKTVFWGKIFGVNANYYIIETEIESGETEIKDMNVSTFF